ncbi:serine hydrolase [Lactobacillus halodurans]|uniref:Serine hydrolase n=2 Tax=Companilactobacillus halodurans TaxID=2584183 RepID=A0A5P0ZMJ7_9LACO|nr:serine hydrolase [Companilactobacillus halodurans]MQS75339.1 serine hydrolase [Companilactobacillus halodurans]MQS97416.1 serine hydrolase [Companilactobacillus halodurans]
MVGLGYYFNNSYALADSDSNSKKQSKTEQAIKKKQKIIKHNLTSYLNSVTEDGTASVSFYNLGAENSSNSKTDQLYQKGDLQVESDAHTVRTAASTYKLYLTAFLMNQKLKGKFSWNTQNTDSFNRMIVNSENDFSEEQINKYGADTISKFVKSQGWYPSVFTEGQAAQTTSYSLQLLLEDLEEGTGAFQNSSDRSKILNLMGKQIYRTGIPTGAQEAKSGTTVQDKVGFLDDTNNDAGIVTLPNGQRYILVIMTNGHNQSNLSGFPRIAEIAKNVQEIVYGDNAGTKMINY